jgi:hypothetical protein
VDPRARLRENPFFVLELPPDATRADVERAGQRLLGELAVGREAARYFATPLGRTERTPERVREAMAELRAPVTRLCHELWAVLHISLADGEDASGNQGSVCAPWLGIRPR